MRALPVLLVLLGSSTAAAEQTAEQTDAHTIHLESLVLAGANPSGGIATFRTSLGFILRSPSVEVRFGGQLDLASMAVPFQGSSDRYVLPGLGGFLEIGRKSDRNVLAGHLSAVSIGGARAQDGPARVALGFRLRRDSVVLAVDALWQTAPGKGFGLQLGLGVAPRSTWGRLGIGLLLGGAVVASFVASFAANTH